MARILIGWELGAGMGHVTRLMKIADALAHRGHEPVLVLRNLVEPWPAYKGCKYRVLQAPMYHAGPSTRRRLRAVAVSDIFALLGFENADELLAMTEAWQQTIDHIQPALIVADYSPTLGLAAYGRHPLITIGDGFTSPPAEMEAFPSLREDAAESSADQNRMLRVVQEVQRRRRRPVPKALPRIFTAEAAYVCCYPELDPYRRYRSAPAIGPFEPMPPPSPCPREPVFFAYLAADFRNFKESVYGIGEIGRPGGAYIRRAPGNTKKYLRERGLRVYDQPAPMAEVLGAATLVIHHGGIGTTERALAAGRPQLLLARHLEQGLTGAALAKLGVGLMLQGKFSRADVAAAARAVLDDRRFADRAMELAADIRTRGYGDNVRRIADGCDRFLSFGRAEPVV